MYIWYTVCVLYLHYIFYVLSVIFIYHIRISYITCKNIHIYDIYSIFTFVSSENAMFWVKFQYGTSLLLFWYFNQVLTVRTCLSDLSRSICIRVDVYLKQRVDGCRLAPQPWPWKVGHLNRLVVCCWVELVILLMEESWQNSWHMIYMYIYIDIYKSIFYIYT